MENRSGKVQDRLYDHHKKQLNLKKHIEEQINKEAKENSKPKILKQTASMVQPTLPMETKKIEERLIGFQKRYEGKKQ